MGSVVLSCAIAVAVLMVGTWALSVRLANVSIVDLVWGLAFVVVAHVGSERWWTPTHESTY